MSGTIAIIGAGASGCMAAISAKRTNPSANVLLLDGNEEVGKKILATGNGRCNFTNDHQSMDCYHSKDPEFVEKALLAFGKEDTLSFFRELGVIADCKNGYYYPMSHQAASIRSCLQFELSHLDVEIHLSTRVIGIEPEKDHYVIRCLNDTFTVDKVILCTGGKAAMHTGSDGSGFSFASKLGQDVIPPVPSLVPLVCKKHPLKAAAGVRILAKVSTEDLDGKQYQDTGEVQITKQGISGIPVFQISHVIARNLAQKADAKIAVDFWPTATAHEIASFVKERRERGEVFASDIFNGIFPKPLIEALFGEDFITRNEETIADRIKCVELSIAQTMGFEAAQTTSGGVRLSQLLDITMESSLHKGLFFAGEVLDVDGICGGYNLQWAWTSGYLAGQSAAKELL